MELEILKRAPRFFLPLFAGVMLFSACEKEANIRLPEVPPRLVINGFICPEDTLIRVRVTKSSPIFQLNQVDVNDPVTDATVTLFGNSTSIQLTYDTALEMYTVPASQFPIVAGNEYRIEASAPGVEENASATTTVPGLPPSDFAASMTYTLDSSEIYYWMYDVNLSTSFTDHAATGNYYRLAGRLIVYDQMTGDTISRPMGTELLIDESVSRNNLIEMSMTSPSWGGYETFERLDIYLVHCSKEYYLYHEALNNYNGGGDPFSEPTLMYTNITGGYGIFAGASYSVKKLNF